MRVIAKPKPDLVRTMARIQAERTLDAPGPTTWRKLVGGDAGHIRQLARQLLANERSFRAAVAVWYRQLGKQLVAAIRAGQEPAGAVTDQHRERLRDIVEEHVRKSALLSAAIEWAIHQVHPSAKACVAYIQKGVWDFAKSLPRKVLDAVKAVVMGVMLVFQPDAVIEPILARVETVVAKAIEEAPNERHSAATIGAAVQDAVFARGRIEQAVAGVAVTANTAAANGGTAAAGEVLAERGIVNARRWACLHGSGKVDNRVRPSHRKANGQTVKIGERFVLDLPGKGGGTETCSGPGDSQLSEGNKRNCRCLAINVWSDPK